MASRALLAANTARDTPDPTPAPVNGERAGEGEGEGERRDDALMGVLVCELKDRLAAAAAAAAGDDREYAPGVLAELRLRLASMRTGDRPSYAPP